MNWLSPLINLLWKRVSPQLREKITEVVADLELKAAATDNPFDDFAIDVLKLILGIST